MNTINRAIGVGDESIRGQRALDGPAGEQQRHARVFLGVDAQGGVRTAAARVDLCHRHMSDGENRFGRPRS